ncbi:transcription elongation regulator 1-like protein [Trichomycterus rosablanca]|uniref:transcription elongation regulator 1-like protein n=1 Tax=Trichomycterus rosablanca TaxID=2290929 RepID=UPI002F34F883
MWPLGTESPQWVWTIPSASGLCTLSSSHHAPLLASPRPPTPPLRTLTSWQLSCDPFLPQLISPIPLPSIQWELPSRPAMLGFQPSAGVDLVPMFPVVYRTILPPHYRKAWLEKRVPDYKVYLNNTLKTTWIGPEEIGIFQRQEKPVLMTNQVAMSISRPAAASRNFHTLLLTPRRISGSRRSWEGLLSSCLPTQITAVRSLPSPTVTLLTGDWKARKAPESKVEVKKPSCSGALVLHSDSTPEEKSEDEQFKVSMDIDSSPKDNRPVASTHVPGSPWCVVWTGDDRVFFFNPTMHLSVWEKPVDLKDRGDLNKIIEDPPHKRKKDSLDDDSNLPSTDEENEDDEGDHILKSKRNKLEQPATDCADASDEKNEVKCMSNQMVLPLELRITHFRDMLLERGVSAFSTWEKELHKIVFDPRYLLLGPDERKQIFDQFVKARIKEEYKERKNKLQQAKEEFRKLLEESKITYRSTFKEFSEKYGQDPRFKRVSKQKDQELLFSQFVNGLKKRDKENRMRLRKMR